MIGDYVAVAAAFLVFCLILAAGLIVVGRRSVRRQHQDFRASLRLAISPVTSKSADTTKWIKLIGKGRRT